MSELTTTLPEIDQQPINPNEDIQSLVGNVDISSFDEKLAPILANPTTKEFLIKELKENQPITGKLMLNRILSKITLELENRNGSKIETEAKEVKTEAKEVKTEAKEKIEKAKLATAEVTNAFSAIEKSIPTDKKTEISAKISAQLTDIKNGNIPNETKNFLNQIGANTPESIASPEVLSLLTAHISTRVYLENKDSILKTNPELGEQFDNLDRNKYALGLSGKIEAKEIGRALTDIPKSDKDTVVSTVNSLTKGAPDTVITRDGDRLSWEDKKGSKYEIDMAARPPKLIKSLNGLSISKEIESVSPEQKEKQILEDKKTKITEVVIKDAGKVQLNTPENIPDSIQNKNLIESYRGAQEGYQKARNPTEKLEALKILKEQNHLLEGERRKSITVENMSDTKYAKLEEGLFRELDGLNQLEISLSDFVETDKKLVTYQGVESKGTIESFDNNASENLSYLVANNFDKLGPSANEAMNRIITEINRTRTSNNQIDLTEQLNQATDGKVLVQALEKLGGTQNIFTNGEKLPQFQDTITSAVTKNADNPGSIESLMRSN
ncbi:hypothetical protein HOO68_03995 [Candidatus Gracilibacteria bacterium]|nr:hypothetical protein [Candidatus Gracilibacteria bacterium]